MYRVILLVVFVVLAAANLEDSMKKCHRLGHAIIMTCCKGFSLPELKVDDLKECMEMPYKPHSCEQDICLGKKRGYISDDGTLDREAFVKTMLEDLNASPNFLETVKEKCVNGNLDSYGPPDACEVRKMKFCFHTQSVRNCEEWDDSGPCAGISDLVRECAKITPEDD